MLAHELSGRNAQAAVEAILEFVFVRQATGALERRMLGAGKGWHEGVPIALGISRDQVCRRHARRLPTTLLASHLPTPRPRGRMLSFVVLRVELIGGDSDHSAWMLDLHCTSRGTCRARQRTKAVDQNGLLQRLARIAPDSQAQHPFPDAIVRIGGDQDRRDRVPRFDQTLVKLDARHCRHVNIGDQAGGSGELGGCEEFGRGREHRDGVAVRLEQSSHGVAKGLVVIDDGDQGWLGHDSFRCVTCSLDNVPDGTTEYRSVAKSYCRSEAEISKPWFRCARAGTWGETSTPGLRDYERSAFFGSRLSLSAIRQSSGSDAASILRIMLLR